MQAKQHVVDALRGLDKSLSNQGWPVEKWLCKKNNKMRRLYRGEKGGRLKEKKGCNVCDPAAQLLNNDWETLKMTSDFNM